MSEGKDMKVQTMMTEVAEGIAKSNGEVRKRLVATLVEREQEERVSLLDSLFQKRETMAAELKKTSRPDVFTYDIEDNETGNFSKPRRDGNKKAAEKIQRLDGAIEKALTSNEWDKLRDIAKKM